jgi:RNA polymerase sigma-70 factor, ECF subfamily
MLLERLNSVGNSRRAFLQLAQFTFSSRIPAFRLITLSDQRMGKSVCFGNPTARIGKMKPEASKSDGLFCPAMSLIHNPTETEDLVEDIYGCTIAAIGRVRAGSNLKIRPFTILRNVWFKQLQRRRPPPPLWNSIRDGKTANLRDIAGSDPHLLYASRGNRAQMGEAMRKRALQFHEGVLLREYEGLCYREMAGVLSLPSWVVMSRPGGARSKLQNAAVGRRAEPTSERSGPNSRYNQYGVSSVGY